MSTSPKVYRLYRFDMVRNEVVADFIKAANDGEAIAAANAAAATGKCEIWDDRRLVAQVEGGAAAPG